MAAHRRHRPPRIVDQGVHHRFTGCAQAATADVETGAAVAGQRQARARCRRVVGVGAPAIGAQVVELHRRVAVHAGVVAFEKMIEPAQLQGIDGGLGGVAQPRLAHRRGPRQVRPGPDHQPLLAGAGAQMVEGGEGAGEKAVEPAAHVQGRQVHHRQAAGHRAFFPVVTVQGAVQPVAVEGAAEQLAHRRRGRVDQFIGGGPVAQAVALRETFVVAVAAVAFGAQLGRPGEAVLQPEGAAFVGPVPVQTEAGHGRRDGLQGRVAAGGGEQLSDALVGKAVHAHPAVAGGQRGQPFQGVLAVPLFIDKGLEAPFRGAAPAHVLDHHQVTLGGVPGRMGVGHRGGDAPPVGLAHQQRRERALALGHIEVRVQPHAVAGAHGHHFRHRRLHTPTPCSTRRSSSSSRSGTPLRISSAKCSSGTITVRV